jgi:hypothetical protein
MIVIFQATILRYRADGGLIWRGRLNRLAAMEAFVRVVETGSFSAARAV